MHTLHELKIWLVDTSNVQRLPPALDAFLTPAEHWRALQLRRAPDRINRLSAYAVLFKLAAEHTGLPLQDIRLQRNRHGKPELQLPAGCAALHVSLSHSGTQVALALADTAVGIDIEKIQPHGWQSLRQMHFANDPWPQDAEPAQTFHQLWCSKEAALKAVGSGLTLPLAQIVLRPLSCCFQPLAAWPQNSGLESVRVAQLNAPAGYAGAIACLGAVRSYRMNACVLEDFC